METLSKAVAWAMIGVLLSTQPGCVTAALLKLGEGSGTAATPETVQPVTYTKAIRAGRMVDLEYDTMVNADGEIYTRMPASVRVDLGSTYWRGLGAAPMDPYCTREMWLRLLPNAPPQPPAPLIPNRPSDFQQVILLHKQRATGFPPMTVQLVGVDAWVVCGAGDAIGFAQVPEPPPPRHGTEGGGRPAGAIVAIVLLFPFALAVDIAGAVFYLAVCLGGKCRL